MSKIIELSRSIYDLCKEDPKIIDIMKALGFEQISSPAVLKTAGRFMTIPKGAEMKGIPLEKIKEEFINRGYSVMS
ncbi:MAG: DUF1858 domain-containing protein [Bacillota bacterium]|nr:DUF1858 domain-containing protein [Bacillota bacterium]